MCYIDTAADIVHDHEERMNCFFLVSFFLSRKYVQYRIISVSHWKGVVSWMARDLTTRILYSQDINESSLNSERW